MNTMGFCYEFFDNTFGLFAQVQSDQGHVLVDAAQEQMLKTPNPPKAIEILKHLVTKLDSLEIKEHAISAQLKTLCTKEESHIANVWKRCMSAGSRFGSYFENEWECYCQRIQRYREGNVSPELLAKLRVICSDPEAKQLDEGLVLGKGSSYVRIDLATLEVLSIPNLVDRRQEAKKNKDYKTIQECDTKIGAALGRIKLLKQKWDLSCHPSEAMDAPAAGPVDTQQIFDSPENFKFVLRTLHENYLKPPIVLCGDG